jgi:purine nucleoside permease
MILTHSDRCSLLTSISDFVRGHVRILQLQGFYFHQFIVEKFQFTINKCLSQFSSNANNHNEHNLLKYNCHNFIVKLSEKYPTVYTQIEGQIQSILTRRNLHGALSISCFINDTRFFFKFHFFLFRAPTFLLAALCDVIVRFAYLYQAYRFHILL